MLTHVEEVNLPRVWKRLKDCISNQNPNLKKKKKLGYFSKKIKRLYLQHTIKKNYKYDKFETFMATISTY